MKSLKIISLKYKNFKGLKEFELNADGKDLNALGGNGTGKTTLFDGFTWLLFGKDSMNRSKFDIKTLNKDGEVNQHGIEHGVEGTFEVDGKPLILKRVYAESWTKQHGASHKTFTGHTNTYYVDEEPVQKKVFDNKVKEIVSDDAFKLLTSPSYFNEHLDKKQRRKTLIEIAGNVTDTEIVEHNKDLEKFIDALEGRDIESFQNIVKARRKKINEEIDTIPTRIDELQLMMPDLSGLDHDVLETELESINKKIDNKQQEINDVKSGAEVNNKRKELSNIEYEISNIKNEHGQDVNQEIYRLQASIQEAKSNVSHLESEIEGEKRLLKSNQNQIGLINKSVTDLRNKWSIKNSEEFQYEGQNTCPTCNQSLPEDEIEGAKQKALESFNQSKSEKLESIQQEAVKMKQESEELKEAAEKINTKIEKKEKDIVETKKQVEKLQDKLETTKGNATDVSENEAYKTKVKEKEAIQKAINTIEESVEQSIAEIKDQINGVEIQKKDVQEKLNKFEQSAKTAERIKELETKEKELSAQLESLDKDLYLADEYTRSKVNLLEGKINSKFKYARFKLFEKQINGGLDEICETIYEGVPYNRGLNNASRINVGLDIIDTLSKHYGVQAPIFIDNAESVNDLIDIDTQVIRLTVGKNNSLQISEVTEAEQSA